MLYATQNMMIEWSCQSGKSYVDPFNEVELDVVITDPGGGEKRVPAFWSGESTWRIRYSPSVSGTHRFRTVCSDADNPSLHDCKGTIEVTPYEGENPLFARGPIQVAPSLRHLQHADGTPFFWLGDTWWMGLCERIRWPDEFQTLTADRVAKGFSVIQIVAGIYPDMPAFDPRGRNEAGYPWDKEFQRINPSYFDMADERINWLVHSGLVPCIVGCWGYYLVEMGIETMKKHWRHLIARWGALPVVWCLAGEGTMPYYLSETKDEDRAFQKKGWTELASYVRETDPFGRLITIHPTDAARNQVEDDALLDFDMLQTGHGDRASLPNTVNRVVESRSRQPVMPVINGEVCYEGICAASREEVQRLMAWSCVLSGACGHTYGANGIWQLNRQEKPYGPSPHGSSWGDTPWQEAYRLPGSRQVGLCRALLERFEWWEFEPHAEWVEPHQTEQDYFKPYAAGIAGSVRVVYMPGPSAPKIKGIEKGVAYKAYYYDPTDGRRIDAGAVNADQDGNWQAPKPPVFQDWVLVLEAKSPE